MKVLAIAIKDLKILIKDKQTIALILIMPIVLVIVLGFSLNSLFEKDQVNIGKTNVVLIDYDKSKQSEDVKEFFETDEIKEYIDLVSLDREEALDKLESGDITGIITIPEKYGKAIENYEPIKISLLVDEGSPVESSIVDSIIRKYADLNSSVLLAGKAADTEFREYKMDGRMILKYISDFIETDDDLVVNGGLTSEGKGLSAMQYYAAAMVSMYILFVGMVGTALLVEEREDNTLKRMLTTYSSKATIIIGKILGIFILGLIDVTVLILFTKLVYHADWGNSLLGLIVLSVAMSFSASGLAILIASMFKSAKVVDMVNPVIILIMAFIGGNMFPLYEMSTLLRKVSYVFMNNWSLRGYLNLMINSGFESIIIPSLVMSGMGVAFMVVGINRLKL